MSGLMTAIGEGILYNDTTTLKQECWSWESIAIQLHRHGYVAMRNEKENIITNSIARIEEPDWAKRNLSAHDYRKEVAIYIWGVPAQIMAYMPKSRDEKHLGYIKSDIIALHESQCSAVWLQHVMRCKRLSPTEIDQRKKQRRRELIEYLRMMGYCQIGVLKIKGISKSSCTIARVDTHKYWTEVPIGVDDSMKAHYYRLHISADRWVKVPKDIYRALPDSAHTKIGFQE